MKTESLQDLYREELTLLYDVETQMVSALPEMIRAASSPELRMAFKVQLEHTPVRVVRLEHILGSLGCFPRRKRGKALAGLLGASVGILTDAPSPAADAVLAAAARHAVHDALAGYGCVRTYARLLFFDDAAALLQESMNEQGAADDRLRRLSANRNRVRLRSLEATV